MANSPTNIIGSLNERDIYSFLNIKYQIAYDLQMKSWCININTPIGVTAFFCDEFMF